MKSKELKHGILTYPSPEHYCNLPSTSFWSRFILKLVAGCTWTCPECDEAYTYRYPRGTTNRTGLNWWPNRCIDDGYFILSPKEK